MPKAIPDLPYYTLIKNAANVHVSSSFPSPRVYRDPGPLVTAHLHVNLELRRSNAHFSTGNSKRRRKAPSPSLIWFAWIGSSSEGEWWTNLDFCDCTYQALWSETPSIPSVNPDLLLEDLDERLCFLRSFESVPEDEVRGTVGKMLSFLKRLRKVRHRSAIGQSL